MIWGVSTCEYFTPYGCSSQPSGEKQMPMVHDHGCGDILIIGMKTDSCVSKYLEPSKRLSTLLGTVEEEWTIITNSAGRKKTVRLFSVFKNSVAHLAENHCLIQI